MLTGFALAFARAVGEYGSVIFIAGNMPNVSEITPLLIVIQAAGIRLRRRHRNGGGDADRFVPSAVPHQRLQTWSDARTERGA